MSEHEILLEVTDLTVEFPGVRALDAVAFDVRAGEVHAVVGENGAGKSTLLKVLGGVYPATSGRLELAGAPYAPGSPHHALAAGIAVIYQEFTLFPDLTVAENVFAGREPYNAVTRGIRYQRLREECTRIFGLLDVDIDPNALVGDLSVSEQQLVEIAKALSVDGRVIVMDEPTAALSQNEVQRLLQIVRRLRDEGRAIVYVSHHLDEVFAVADRATVLRDGKHIATVDIAATDQRELVRLMVGRDVATVFGRERTTPGDIVLDVQNLTAGKLRDLTLQLHAGEVLGIGGVAGAGQRDLAQVVFGAIPIRAGAMTLAGRDYAPSTHAAAIAAGVGYLHDDRKSAGIFRHLPVLHNLTITVLDRLRGVARLLSRPKELAVYAGYHDRLRIKSTSPAQLVSQLSGGNQQKVLLGRALAPGGTVLVLNEPTRGVDIGAKAEIHQLVNELTASGVAVLMVSSDLPELVGMSDRIVVLSQGRVVGRLEGPDRTEENVIACATTDVRIGVSS